MTFNINLAPKWRFDVDFKCSVDPKIRRGREPSQRSGLMTKWSRERERERKRERERAGLKIIPKFDYAYKVL